MQISQIKEAKLAAANNAHTHTHTQSEDICITIKKSELLEMLLIIMQFVCLYVSIWQQSE